MYSLGMLLYHMIKGEPYFGNTDVRNIVKNQITDIRLKTSNKLSGVTKDVQILVDTLIHIDRSERYSYYTDAMEVVLGILDEMKTKTTQDSRIVQRRMGFPDLLKYWQREVNK